MRIQLWSYNYDPEPSGIAPLSTVWAQAMLTRGHDVLVVAAHPHYPKPIWGKRRRPYRERRNDVPVLRLPLWVGRDTAMQRMRQEFSALASLAGVAPVLPPADVIVAVSPSFPNLLPAMLTATIRRTPWVLWLQDILPDGAATTGLVEGAFLLDAARRFERLAYGSASRIIVISDAFERNLRKKGVPQEKMVRIYNPSAILIPEYSPPAAAERRLLIMGNIGHSQGLTQVVRAVQESGVLERTGGELRIAGHGVGQDDVAAVISSQRVKMLGLLLGQDMEDELARAAVGVVTQRPDLTEFNLPSKLMNYMAHGLPVLAVVDPASETARIVRDTGAGWVVDSRRLAEGLGRACEEILLNEDEIVRRGRAAYEVAIREFSPERIAAHYEFVLREVVAASGR